MKPLLIAFVSIATTFAGYAAQVSPAAADQKSPAKTKDTRPPWEREWAYLSRYRDANARLPSPGPGEKRVVFYGDSITDAWPVEKSFPGKPYLNRGISGQTTSQMLVRFRQDVIDLKPAAVLILAGTNDIAGNGGETTVKAIEDNLQSMAELARFNHIRVALASVLPTNDYPWRPGREPAGKIARLNRWIASYCAAAHLVYLDYYSSMAAPNRDMKHELTKDGVHPNGAGYAVMAPLAEKAIAEVLK